MPKNKSQKKTSQDSLHALLDMQNAQYDLRLYINGNTTSSQRALLNIKSLCEKFLKGVYTLKVIDIHQQPQIAHEDQIIATPTLIKKRPLPERRLIGDFSDPRRVQVGLDLLERVALLSKRLKSSK